jgi:hypothetical protein
MVILPGLDVHSRDVVMYSVAPRRWSLGERAPCPHGRLASEDIYFQMVSMEVARSTRSGFDKPSASHRILTAKRGRAFFLSSLPVPKSFISTPSALEERVVMKDDIEEGTVHP